MFEKNNLYMVKAMYLGSEPMGELFEGENGSDAIQVPLKRTILRTENVGEEVELSMTNDSLVVTFVHSSKSNQKRLVLPIDLLAYCGALRQLPSSRIKEREFETLDKSPSLNPNDPPLFVTIFRNFEQENTLFCHSFIIRKDDEAMELVKLVMEIYYNLIRLQELDETSFQDQDENLSMKSSSSIRNNDDSHESKIDLQSLSINRTEDATFLREESGISDYNSLLDIYNKLPVSDSSAVNTSSSSNHQKESRQNLSHTNYTTTNAEESLSYNVKKVGENNYEIVPATESAQQQQQKIKSGAMAATTSSLEESQVNELLEQVNEDTNPIVIRRKNEENIEYKQNVFIRWLQPPTPPPPAPIIIREIQEEAPEEPPLIIYKQAPRPETPPPLVIRERPPSPLQQPTEPFVIEKRIPYQQRERKVIIEHLPAPPAKPRDIILEKWLPNNVTGERTVYYQKLNNHTQSSQYDFVDELNNSQRYPKGRQQAIRSPPTTYRNASCKQIGDNYTSTVRSQHNNHSFSSDIRENQIQMNNQDIYYPSSNTSSKKKVAGYRIIRQIIPGPNSTPAEIQKALARSQHVSTTMMNNNQVYSSYEKANNRLQPHQQVYSGGSNGNIADMYSNPGSIYNMPGQLNGPSQERQSSIYNSTKKMNQSMSNSCEYMHKKYTSQQDIYMNK